MNSAKLFQTVQALLLAILLLGGGFFIMVGYPYGWAMVGMGVLLFLYDRRGLLLMLLANLAYKRKGIGAALDWFDRAWKWKSLDGNGSVTYAFLLMKNGQWEKAGEVFKLMKVRGPWKIDQKFGDLAESYEALFLWRSGQKNEAVQQLERLRGSGYISRALLTTLGSYLLEMKRYPEAELVCKQGTDYDENDAGLWDNWGYYLFLTGQAEEAKRIYESRIIPNSPSFPDAWYHYARILRTEGDKNNALAAYSTALGKNFHSLSLATKEQIEKEKQELGI